eukprot:1769125-Pyramimonas_sp.AAC.1
MELSDGFSTPPPKKAPTTPLLGSACSLDSVAEPSTAEPPSAPTKSSSTMPGTQDWRAFCMAGLEEAEAMESELADAASGASLAT